MPARRRDLATVLAAGLVAVLLMACRRSDSDGRPPSPIAAADPALLPIPLPSWRLLDEPSRLSMREREVRLAAAAGDRRTPRGGLAEAYGALGKTYQALGLFDTALPCYENARRLDPGAFAWPYLLARVEWSLDRPEAARDAVEKALALRPGDVPALLFLADLHRAAGRFGPAQEACRRALEASPGSPAALYGLGQAAFLAGDFPAAIQSFEAVLQAQPQATRIHYQLSLAYRRIGDVGKADLHMARRGDGMPAAAPDPLLEEVSRINPRATARRALAVLRSGNLAQAVGLLRAASEASPEDVELRLQLGFALAGTGRHEEALVELREALRRKPDDPRLHFHIGSSLGALGRDREALDAMRRAVELNPENAQAQLGLAQALRRMGRSDEALRPLEEAVRLDPTSVPARLARARVQARLGRCRDAVDGVERSVQAFPEDRTLSVTLAALLSACPDAAVRDAGRAVGLARQAFDAEATVDHAAAVALAQAAGGHWSEAEAWQRRALALLPEDRPRIRAALTQRLDAYREKRLPAVEW